MNICCVLCGAKAEIPVSQLWDNYGVYCNPTGEAPETPCKLSREPRPGWRLGKFAGPQGRAYNVVCPICAQIEVIPYLEGFVEETISDVQ